MTCCFRAAINETQWRHGNGGQWLHDTLFVIARGMGCKLQEEVARTGSASSSDVPAAQRQRSEQLRPRSRFNRPQVPSRRLNDIDVDAMRGTLGSVQVFNDVGRTAMTAVEEIRAGGSVRCDYVILRRGTDDVAGAIELKSMKTMGLILDEDLDTLMTGDKLQLTV